MSTSKLAMMAVTSSRLAGASSAIRMRTPEGRLDMTGTGTAAAAPARPSGTSNQKVEPSPGRLSAPITPPIISISRREIASPSPVPP